MDNKINVLTDSVNVTMHSSSLTHGRYSFAKVQRSTAYIGNIVERVNKNAVIPGGKETLLYVAGLLRDGIVEFLHEGKAVDLLEMGILYLKPKKGMEVTAPGIEDIPKMKLAFTPSDLALKAVENVTVGADVTKENVPTFSELYDIHSMSAGNVLTAGFTVRVSGKGLKVAGDDCGVYLAPCTENGTYQTDSSDWLLICGTEDFIDNTASRLEFNLPSDVAKGSYRLIVKTAYSSGSRLNKTSRAGIMDGIVTVA